MKTRVLVLVVLFVATSAFLARAQRAEPVPIKEPLDSLPLTFGQWQGRLEKPFDGPILAVLGVDEYTLRTYWRDRDSVLGLYIGYYESQRQGDTIHSPLNCLPGAGWIPMEQGHTSVRVFSRGSPRVIEVNRVVIQKGLDRSLVMYWYQSHGRVVASEYWGKVYTVVDAIRLNRTDAALVRVTVPIREAAPDAAASDAAATGFIEALFPVLERHLPS